MAHRVGEADVVTAVETIEHLENPWAFFRSRRDH
jgi:2-polyprenyl-3-methyl-5-hydroxy-6-metoxy-1,4-benzoquinol methylase